MYFGIVDKYTIEQLKPIGEKPLLIRILDQEEKNPKYYHNFISRSEEHKSELQSHSDISYTVFFYTTHL